MVADTGWQGRGRRVLCCVSSSTCGSSLLCLCYLHSNSNRQKHIANIKCFIIISSSLVPYTKSCMSLRGGYKAVESEKWIMVHTKLKVKVIQAQEEGFFIRGKKKSQSRSQFLTYRTVRFLSGRGALSGSFHILGKEKGWAPRWVNWEAQGAKGTRSIRERLTSTEGGFWRPWAPDESWMSWVTKVLGNRC